MKRFWKKTEGFTLVELIVVIAILGILAGVGTVGYSGYVKKANMAADNQLLVALNQAYAVACIENGVDAKQTTAGNITIGDDKKVAATDVQVSNPAAKKAAIEASFVKYFAGNENAEFKYFTGLNFVSAKGVFEGVTAGGFAQKLAAFWENSSFKDEDGTIAKELLVTFDGIGGFFTEGIGEDGDIDLGDVLPSLSGDLAAALGFDEMIAGINSAMGGEESETAKGNAAVLYFAEAAATQSVEDVQSSVEYFMQVLNGVKKDEEGNLLPVEPVDDDYVAKYILSTLPTDSEEYEYLSDVYNEDGASAVLEFTEEWPVALFDLDMDYRSMAQLDKTAKELNASGASNTTGVSSLGAMYALAAGYYKSTGTEPPAGESLGTFGGVQHAMKQDEFQTYYNTQGKADLEAYMSFMGYLSTGDFNMETEDVFADAGYEYIAEVLGFTK